MALPLALAHRRYRQQAGWTAQLRRHILSRAGLPNARRVLEIGCGTGAVLGTVRHGPQTRLFGVDIDLPSPRIAYQEAPDSGLAAGDAHSLPFPNAVFDISFFHFVLLWLADPATALAEAIRVTRTGGAVIAFAEPDYSQRVIEDASMSKIGGLQMENLRAQGANPAIGGSLAEIFAAAGIQTVEFGALQPAPATLEGDALELELDVLRSDLAGSLPAQDLEKTLETLRETESEFVSLQVPTYFCWGRVLGGGFRPVPPAT